MGGEITETFPRRYDAMAATSSAWIDPLARFGYAAKGAVYCLIGGLAVAAAFTGGGRTTDSGGAMSSIADAPLGRAILGTIALGLAGYVIWQIVRAVKDPQDKGAGHRAFYVLTAIIHTGLAWQAGMLALGGSGSGSNGGSSGGSASSWSAKLMQQPFGPWLVGIVGGAIAAYGLQQLWNAWKVDLDDQLELASMSRTTRKWTVRVSRLGLAARGVVLDIIGGYLIVAALQSDPSEAKGLGEVLSMMEGTPWLLGVVAFGLMAYGVYYVVRARYREVHVV